MLRLPGQLVGSMREDFGHGSALPQPGLDVRRRTGRAAPLHQPVDVLAVAAIGGDASGGRVRLLDEALFLEPGQDVAHRGRGHGATGMAGQPLRGDRLAVLDVFADQRAEQAQHTIRQFRRRVRDLRRVRQWCREIRWVGLAVSPRDC